MVVWGGFKISFYKESCTIGHAHYDQEGTCSYQVQVCGRDRLNNSDGASITYVHVFTFLNKRSAEGEQV